MMSDEKLFMVDFGAEWCGPCKKVEPVIAELAALYEGKINVGKVDVDENEDLASEYGIRSIPTILFFKKGEQVGKFIGAVSRAEIENKITECM
jgi:thioredoxin 1